MGDFNGDGIQDLAVGSSDSANVPILLGRVSIFLGDGAGNFSGPTRFAAPNSHSITVGDFNGDGNQDLALAPGISILWGDGHGNFSYPTSFDGGFGSC